VRSRLFFLGSTAAYLAAHSQAPVLVLRSKAANRAEAAAEAMR
jgi:nucleotide-binding universal stress UspA family protein